MEQFSKVLQELRIWFADNKYTSMLIPFNLILLFGGLAVIFLHDFLFHLTPYRFTGFHNFLSFVFYDIPLITIAGFAYLLGVWLTLISKDIKLAAFGIWAHVLITLYPFTYLTLSSLLHAAVYIFLGYLVYKYSQLFMLKFKCFMKKLHT